MKLTTTTTKGLHYYFYCFQEEIVIALLYEKLTASAIKYSPLHTRQWDQFQLRVKSSYLILASAKNLKWEVITTSLIIY